MDKTVYAIIEYVDGKERGLTALFTTRDAAERQAARLEDGKFMEQQSERIAYEDDGEVIPDAAEYTYRVEEWLLRDR